MGKKNEKHLFNKENICEKTFLLNTTDDTDIIECSITEYENQNDCLKNCVLDLKTPKVSEEDLGALLNVTKLMTIENQYSKHPKGVNGALRETIKKRYSIIDGAPIAEKVKNDHHMQTPSPVKNSNPHVVLSKVMSTVKKSPDCLYLSKSKLKNIEEWLVKNDVATIRTPPFANLSVTPNVSKRKNLITAATTTRKREKENKFEDSSIDSEVECVLRAVYGDDWNLSKTEPKRKINSNYLYGLEGKKEKKSQSVRRNILSTNKSKMGIVGDEQISDRDDFNVSGVKLMNLDISNCGEDFIKTKKLKNLRHKKKSDAVNRGLDSLTPASTKKVGDKLTFDFENRELAAKGVPTSKPRVSLKTPKKTFLASLSVSTPTSRCHPDAQYYKVNFKSKKEELVKKLFRLYNGEIFEGKLAEDMNFSWNVKLRGTAGFCFNKRITKSTGDVIRLSRVEFSTKVVDRADRLRDTMIHELCHAASWIINGVLDGHGPVWSAWANKATTRFPELPPIKRCHNYDIASKYVYRCTGCGYSIKRHSKSINTERKRCGHCYGVLELLLNKKKKGKGEVPEFNITRTLRTPNKFALFVKENYHSVKSLKTQANHAQIMKTLSQRYALLKTGTKSEKKFSED